MKLQFDPSVVLKPLNQVSSGKAFMYETASGKLESYLRIRLEGSHGYVLCNLHLETSTIHNGLVEESTVIVVPNPVITSGNLPS